MISGLGGEIGPFQAAPSANKRYLRVNGKTFLEYIFDDLVAIWDRCTCRIVSGTEVEILGKAMVEHVASVEAMS